MEEDTQFISYGVYKLKSFEDADIVFVCIPAVGNTVAKLVQYKKNSTDGYKRTPIVYFLNCYKSDDIKSLFLNREHYDLIGRVGSNFCLTKDESMMVGG